MGKIDKAQKVIKINLLLGKILWYKGCQKKSEEQGGNFCIVTVLKTYYTFKQSLVKFKTKNGIRIIKTVYTVLSAVLKGIYSGDKKANKCMDKKTRGNS